MAVTLAGALPDDIEHVHGDITSFDQARRSPPLLRRACGGRGRGRYMQFFTCGLADLLSEGDEVIKLHNIRPLTIPIAVIKGYNMGMV